MVCDENSHRILRGKNIEVLYVGDTHTNWKLYNRYLTAGLVGVRQETTFDSKIWQNVLGAQLYML